MSRIVPHAACRRSPRHCLQTLTWPGHGGRGNQERPNQERARSEGVHHYSAIGKVDRQSTAIIINHKTSPQLVLPSDNEKGRHLPCEFH